jgi:putative Mg2+ transporter-C (MgtC) family protein
MPVNPSWWPDLVLRLALTVVAGALVGLNRGEHGRPAGLRTTLLVCLAASVSMIQVNLLLGATGKASDSFVVLDLMRLPLGILSGMGFIGAGAILRKDNLIMGVTTAATLWFVTVLGLCFGGGQVLLGLIGLGIALFVLTVLKEVEKRVLEDRRAVVKMSLATTGPKEREIKEEFEREKLQIASWKITYASDRQLRELEFVVHWRRRAMDLEPPPLIESMAHRQGVLTLEWSD